VAGRDSGAVTQLAFDQWWKDVQAVADAIQKTNPDFDDVDRVEFLHSAVARATRLPDFSRRVPRFSKGAQRAVDWR